MPVDLHLTAIQEIYASLVLPALSAIVHPIPLVQFRGLPVCISHTAVHLP